MSNLHRASLPNARRVGDSLATARARVTRALTGLELPDCFVFSTVAAEARLLVVAPRKRTDGQRAALRRVAAKARKLTGVTL